MYTPKLPKLPSEGIVSANGYTVRFDDLVDNQEYGEAWSYICNKCAKSLPKWKSRIAWDEAPEEAYCGVAGCERFAENYIDFKRKEITPIYPKSIHKVPTKAPKLVISEVSSKRKSYGKKR